MPKRLPDPDLAAVFAALPDEDRATVARWELMLGLPPGGWVAVPSLRETAITLAITALADSMDHLPIADAIDAACVELGIEDDGEGTDRPSASVARRFRRWRTEARALVDIFVRDSDAA